MKCTLRQGEFVGRTCRWCGFRRFAFVSLAAMALGGGIVRAEVNLVFRTTSPVVRVGERVTVQLLAVSDSEADQSLLGVDVVLSWDPTVLALRADLGGSPFNWTSASFPYDENLDELNADCAPDAFCSTYTGLPFNDGDAWYSAWAFVLNANYPQATPEGLLITAFEFEVLAPDVSTSIEFLPAAGTFSFTRVATADEGGTFLVTGELIGRKLYPAACGERGDFDNNCLIDMSDVFFFSPCLTGPSVPAVPVGCGIADIDADGDADLADVSLLQLAYEGT